MMDDRSNMQPLRPHLFKAYYDWILESDCTPYLVVDAEYPHVMVPVKFVQNGQIVLNVSPSATQGFSVSDSAIEFNARFGGQSQRLYIPLGAALALYAKENGEGTAFPPEACYHKDSWDDSEQPLSDEAEVDTVSATPKKGKANLTVVK